MGKVNSDSTRKVWENATLGFLFIEIMGFLNISREAKIYKIFKKCKYSKDMGFLQISREAEIHTIPKRWDE